MIALFRSRTRRTLLAAAVIAVLVGSAAGIAWAYFSDSGKTLTASFSAATFGPPVFSGAGEWSDLSKGSLHFIGIDANTVGTITVTVCTISSTSCPPADVVGTASTSSGAINADGTWVTGRIGPPFLDVGSAPDYIGPTYFAYAVQAGGGQTPTFSFKAHPTDWSHVVITNGGVAGQADAGDHAAATFTMALNPHTICSGFSTSTSSIQTITGITLTLEFDANDDRLEAPASCPGAGYFETAQAEQYLTAGAVTWNNSSISWNPFTYTLTFTLGGAEAGDTANLTTGNAQGQPAYNAANCNTGGLQDIAGDSIPGCANAQGLGDPNNSGY